jgi:hypothetical protein
MTTDDQRALEGVSVNYAFRNWKDLPLREQLLAMISDNYKDLYGMRPRHDVSHLTDSQLQEWNDRLVEDIDREYNQKIDDERLHQKAVAEVMNRKEWTIGDVLAVLA